MASPATLMRSALKSILETEFSDLNFAGGVRDDRLHGALGTDGNYCATFPVEEVEMLGDVNVQNTAIGVQLFLRWNKKVDPKQTVDPSIIETVAHRAKRAIRAGSQGLGQENLWFYRVTRLSYPPDPTGNITRFEAEVVGYGENAGVTETSA